MPREMIQPLFFSWCRGVEPMDSGALLLEETEQIRCVCAWNIARSPFVAARLGRKGETVRRRAAVRDGAKRSRMSGRENGAGVPVCSDP